MQTELEQLLDGVIDRSARIVVLTGAGISVESGIPTFRGNDGYWVVGSTNYVPEEMATSRMFSREPEQVWRWYLYRFGSCRHAKPNRAHRALVDLELSLGDRFRLVTQNIDGLHRRAGSSAERTYCIHGDAAYVRCANECTEGTLELPRVEAPALGEQFPAQLREQLTCWNCGSWLRPHVLWFDEYYDEDYYRADSAVRAASEADLLLVVGTSGATSLPMQMGALCLRNGVAILDVNPEPNPFGVIAERAERGFACHQSACDGVPMIVEYIVERLGH